MINTMECKNMRFIYPAIITKYDDGHYEADFPDLKLCHAEGASEMEVLREAKAAAYDWIDLELKEDEPDLPPASDPEDLHPGSNAFVRNILVIYRMHEGWDE